MFFRPSHPTSCICAGHKNAVLELHWTTDGERIITASPDRSVRAWDVHSGEQVKKMQEHDNFVNSCCPLRRGPPLLVSGSDDGSAKVRRCLQFWGTDPQLESSPHSSRQCQSSSSPICKAQTSDLRRIELQPTGLTDAAISKLDDALRAHLSQLDNHSVEDVVMLQVWDLRSKRSVSTFTEQYQVTSVAFSDAGDQVPSFSWSA